MAEVVTRRNIVAGSPDTLSWGAILGGAVAALAVWLLLYSLGLALGLSTIDPDQPSSARSSGLFTGIWSLVTPLVALFVGGLVASRGAGTIGRGAGALHGLVVWSLATLVGVWLLTSLATSVMSGVKSIGEKAVSAGGAAVAGAVGLGEEGGVAESFGLDADAAVAPLNQRLRALGRPEITAEQLRAATRDAVQDAVRTGTLDRQTLVSSIADNTALSRIDAMLAAASVQTQFDEWKARAQARLAAAGEAAKAGALEAAEPAGKVFWGVFGALVLGLVSALVGGALGVSRRQRMWAATATTTTVTPEPMVTPTVEPTVVAPGAHPAPT